MSSFVEEFGFRKSGHLGPYQLWSKMSSFAEKKHYAKEDI